MIIDCAVYREGVRETTDHDEESLEAALAALGDDDFLWIGIGNPTADEMHRVAGPLGLPPAGRRGRARGPSAAQGRALRRPHLHLDPHRVVQR